MRVVVRDTWRGNYLKEDLFTELVWLASKKGFSVISLEITKDSEVAVANDASRTRANIQAPAVGVTTLPESVGQFSIKMTLGKVNYVGLKSWLYTMENSLRLMDVQSITFDPKAETVALNMTSYYYKN